MTLQRWLEENVLDYELGKGFLDFEIEVFDFNYEGGETIYTGALSDIPNEILQLRFVNIEFAGIKDARMVVFNVDSAL